MNQFGILNNLSNNEKIYRLLPFMANCCVEIITQSTNAKKMFV